MFEIFPSNERYVLLNNSFTPLNTQSIDEMVCGDVLTWSLECLNNLTNQIATSNCKESINSYISNLEKSQVVQIEPKSKKGEIPKNHKNITEKEIKLEPKEVSYFVSQIESCFIEVAQKEGVTVPHQFKGKYL